MTSVFDDTLFIFDCDGVLVDSEYIIASVEAEVLSAEGYPLSPEEDIRLFSGKSQRSMLDTVEASLGRKFPEGFGEHIEKLAAKRLSTELKACEHIHALLEKISLKCVASSSTPPMIRHSLETAGLDGFFKPDAIFSATMVEKGKPHPDLFLLAAEKMERSPEGCIVVEDSFAGVEAARAAGMTAIGYVGASHIIDPDHAKKLKQLGAKEVFPCILQIIQFLEQGGSR
ncbi:MAG: HAD family hydrolase [Bdellovibrionales bacterium]